MAFSRSAATRRVRDAMLGKANRRLAELWLSKCSEDGPPAYSGFETAALSDLAPGFAVFAIADAADTLRCIYWGEAVRKSTGIDLTGKDWLAETPPEQRAERLKRYRAVASGSIGHCMRYAQHRSGEVHYVEEIMLPFAPDATGLRHVLVHLGWRPLEADESSPEIRNSRAIADEFTLISLGPEPAIG